MKTIVYFITALILVSGSISAQLPEGFYMSLDDSSLEPGNPKDYNIGTDKSTKYGGRLSAVIESRNSTPEGRAMLVQEVTAADYRGKRIRVSAFVNTDNVVYWSGLLMHIEGTRYGKADPRIAADFMLDRPIKGTMEWRKKDIVMDVPPEAQRIIFGVWLEGKGKIWADDFQIEIVGNDVPVTAGRKVLKYPRNLNMEE